MIECTCKDWQTVGELFHETIGMVHIDYCPWCGAYLHEITEDNITTFEETPDDLQI